MSGRVYLVGAGPGDIELITVKGMRKLSEADVILYDHLIHHSLLEWAKSSAILVDVGKYGGHDVRQSAINEQLIAYAREGHCVVRLKGGDPFLFGRGSEECEALIEAKIPFEVVPGIASPLGGAHYSGIPLTHRTISRSVAFATGHLQAGDENEQIKVPVADTIVFLMAMKNLELIVRKLLEAGHSGDEPAALIEQATRSEHRTVVGDLNSIVSLRDEREVQPPALFIVGEVVALRNELQWYENKPLFGRRIAITRPEGMNGSLFHQLSDLGADVLLAPSTQLIADEGASETLTRAYLSRFSDVIFSSRNGIDFFMESLRRNKLDLRVLSDKFISVIGAKTFQHLERRGLRADLLPEQALAEGLLDKLPADLSGRVFLLPRAAHARDELIIGIESRGGTVEEVILYHSKPRTQRVSKGISLDGLCFTSESTLTGWVLSEGVDSKLPVFCIGPVTEAAAEKAGYEAVFTSEIASIEGLIHCIQSFFLNHATN